MKSTFLPLLGAILVGLAMAHTVRANPLPNPGFENGEDSWGIDASMSKVIPEAAHEGKSGLRVSDHDTTAGSSALSARLPVKPDQEIELTFWARTESSFVGVYLKFFNAGGSVIKDPEQRAGAGSPVCAVNKIDGAWNLYTLSTKVPAEAESVAIWIHSFGSATGEADFDDFALEGIDEGPHAIAPPAAASTPASGPLNLPIRQQPPAIIIKADDLRQTDGKVNGLWFKFVEFLKARHIKGSIGIICQTMEQATPEYLQWIKDNEASGDIEFWFHGWDHAVWTDPAGKQFNEFNGRSYEEQKKRFDDSQKLALEKLGWAFATFGPPGGLATPTSDASTIRVMADEPDMKVWLYSTPIDEVGKKLESEGKITILDRVWEVNLEVQVGKPNFQKFLEGYAKNPDRKYFVLQGHPMHWGSPAEWNEFVKIIDFLTEQKAVFMTPTEYAASKAREESHPPRASVGN